MTDNRADSNKKIDMEGIPPGWAHVPYGYSNHRWKQIIEDVVYFNDHWDEKAAQLGWTESQVFGIDRGYPEERIDRMGLVPLLRGRRVLEITSDEAVIEADPYGATQRVPRCRDTGYWPVYELTLYQFNDCWDDSEARGLIPK